MKRKKLWVTFIVIFTGGIIAGWAMNEIFHLLARHMMGFRPPREIRHHIINRISDDLDLSAEQKKSLLTNFSENYAKIEANHLRMRDEATKMMDNAVENVVPPLTDDQRKRFETHKKERDRHFKEMEEWKNKSKSAR